MRVLTNAWAWPVKARDRLEWILCTEEVVDALRHTLLDVWTGKSPRRKPRCQTPCRTRALAAWQIRHEQRAHLGFARGAGGTHD